MTSGTGFTVQRAQVVSVAAGVATMDKAMGTTGSTGGNGKLGGAVVTPATIASLLVAGNTIYVKGAISTAAVVSLTVSGTDAARITMEGFESTPGDGGQATITATDAAATSVISNTGDFWIFKNLTLDGASLSLRGLYLNSVTLETIVDNCWLKGATQYGLLVNAFSDGVRVSRCLATGNGASGAHAGFGVSGSNVLFDRCVARDNAGNGFAAIDTWLNAVHCYAHDNTLSGFYHDGNNTSPKLLHCTSQGNTLDGLRIAAASSLAGGLVRHNLFAGNAGYGIRSITTDYSSDARLKLCFETNAFYNNTLGARFQVPTGTTDISLTADPFMDSASADEDLSLNLAIGGGLDARGLAMGFGLRSDPETSAGRVDAGAIQSGGGVGAATGLGKARSLWRELTNERNTTTHPDSVVDLYLQRGAEALNDAIRYHRTTTTITLVAGTQEYATPDDFQEAEWVAFLNKDLEKGDIERWRQEGADWRTETPGVPGRWAVYANKIVLRPAPDAYAVSQSSTLTLRYISTPADVSTSGFAQLPTHYHRLVVYYAAALYAGAYPESQRSVLLEKTLMDRFTAEAKMAAADYAGRPLG